LIILHAWHRIFHVQLSKLIHPLQHITFISYPFLACGGKGERKERGKETMTKEKGAFTYWVEWRKTRSNASKIRYEERKEERKDQDTTSTATTPLRFLMVLQRRGRRAHVHAWLACPCPARMRLQSRARGLYRMDHHYHCC